MTRRDLLETAPASATWDFPPAEYRRRMDNVRGRMAAAGMDCIMLTSEKDIRYLTGFYSQTWINRTRPRYVIIPLDAEPIAIVPTANLEGFRATSWIVDVHSWPAPRPADDGVSLVIDALYKLVPSGHRIGAELGHETRIDLPVADFLRIRSALSDRRFLDAGLVMHPLRMIKSADEIERIRRTAQLASDGFDRLRSWLTAGRTERDLYDFLHRSLVELGAEKIPYLVPSSGPNGYTLINMGPSDRVLVGGDLVFVDVGATWRGYFCDFNRNFAIGAPTDELKSAYTRLFEATQAGIEAVQPGRTAAQVWKAMAKVLGHAGSGETPVGRMGHGLGLDLTEPPSLAPDDETVLETGMTLTIEPSLVLSTIVGTPPRLMVHEENIVVNDSGAELLSRRAPSVLPVL